MSFVSRIIRRLVSGGPPADEPVRLPSPDELVLVARPNGEPEAEFLRQMLENEGIPCLVRNRDAASARAGGGGPFWAYDICVLRKDLRRAREALAIGPGSPK